MSAWSVNIVSAFGRGETLAIALQEAGFQTRILDFTAVFAPEYQRGSGPFPIIDKAFLPLQREYLNDVELQPQGLTLWLQDGPIELTGPLASVHIHSNPEIQAWKTNSMGGEFSRTWLQHFLRQWTSPYFAESWSGTRRFDKMFPAELPAGGIPAIFENKSHGFVRARAKNIEVTHCTALRDVRLEAGRIQGIEVDAGSAVALQSPRWVWCLSSSETEHVGKEAAQKIFGRGIMKPEWGWLSFGGVLNRGPWSVGLPKAVVVIGDVFLPWYYANVAILRRVDETRFRVWIKVPRSRSLDIDARRSWATELQKLMQQRLPQAAMKVDSADWNLCPHSEIYAESQRGTRVNQYKNWNLISPEVLPRLDISARLEAEADAFNRIVVWRNQEMKKQGGRRDQPIHAS